MLLGLQGATPPAPGRWYQEVEGAVGDPPPEDEFGGRGVLHVFTDERDERKRSSGGTIADGEPLAELSTGHLMMPVVNENSGAAAQPFRVVLHGSAFGTRRLDLLIRKLESPTNLDIAVVDRSHEVLIVSERPS